MDSNGKSELYNDTREVISNMLNEAELKLGRKDTLELLSSLVEDFDLKTASNLIFCDCEPSLNKDVLIEKQYCEGNEEAGFIALSSVLDFAKEILNCDDDYGNVKFQDFVRPETKEEREKEHHSDDIEWMTEDTGIDKDKLNIQFEMD